MKAGEFIYREDPRDTPEVRRRKKCWQYGIEVVIEATSSGLCKIHVTKNDKVIVEGTKYFAQPEKAGKDKFSIQKKGKSKSILYDKVNEIYEIYYQKIVAKENKQKTSHLDLKVA